MWGFHMVVSVVRIFLIRQKRQIRQIQLYGNQALGITPITEHRSQLCSNLFDAIVTDPNHKLQGLLPQKNNASYNFRNNCPFVLPRAHTAHTADSFHRCHSTVSCHRCHTNVNIAVTAVSAATADTVLPVVTAVTAVSVAIAVTLM